ncbi:Dynamitin-domain-containing protein [Schizophyllum commune]
MSSTKYANLPDIDTAPDIYETEETFNSNVANSKADDDEDDIPSRSRMRTTDSTPRQANPDELDTRTVNPEDAQKKFRKAEQRRERFRSRYTYPPSPSRSRSRSPSKERPLPISKRLLAIQAELESIEAEVSGSAKEKIVSEENIDPGELIRGLTDVRRRLGQIKKDKEGRGRLVEMITGEEGEGKGVGEKEDGGEGKEKTKKGEKEEVRSVVEIDKRVGELEKLVGAATTVLDETTPLPAPLLPMLSRLHSQLTLLTQPRHIDSISRRLKVLLTDLDRVSQAQHGHRRHPSQSKDQSQAAVPSPLSEQLMPLLNRLSPALPHIPHILTRLRTLSQLHTSAAEFQSTLEGLEEEQRKMRETLNDLESAVASVENSLKENRDLVKGNVEGLDSRVDDVVKRLEALQH